MPEEQETPDGETPTPPGDSGIAPPPLFSPHVYVQDKQERCTFESGYTSDFASFMVSDYEAVYPIVLLAQKYNVPVMWKRVLEILVHEACALKPQAGFTVHDVRCKVDVGEQTGRTELAEPTEQKVVWNQTFKFNVGEPCNIVVLLYCINSIMPNDRLGRVWVTPSQLIEGKTLTEWFPLNTDGEIKLSITLAPPNPMPFKFSFSSRISISSLDSHIFNANDEKVFTLIGRWPYSISLLDTRSNSVLTFKNCVNEPREREYALYLYGKTSSALTLTQTCGIGDSEFKIVGLPRIATVKTNLRNFSFFSSSNTRVASAKFEEQKYYVEIDPGEDTIIILATVALIAKLLFAEGKETLEKHVRSSVFYRGCLPFHSFCPVPPPPKPSCRTTFSVLV